jgi:hypothetical protein
MMPVLQELIATGAVDPFEYPYPLPQLFVNHCAPLICMRLVISLGYTPDLRQVNWLSWAKIFYEEGNST